MCRKLKLEQNEMQLNKKIVKARNNYMPNNCPLREFKTTNATADISITFQQIEKLM